MHHIVGTFHLCYVTIHPNAKIVQSNSLFGMSKLFSDPVGILLHCLNRDFTNMNFPIKLLHIFYIYKKVV